MASNSIIIYPNQSGGIILCFPAPECDIPITEIARKDVPPGTPYKIVPADSIPTEYIMFFDAYEADFTNPDGYGIGPEAWFAEKEYKP